MKKKSNEIARAPLTYQELERLLPSEISSLKLSEEEIAMRRQINMAKKLKNEERVARLRIEQKPLLSELAEVGLLVDSVWDLVNTTKPYPEAIDILLKHLNLAYSDRIRAGIARSLAVKEPEVIAAWRFLVDQYRRAPTGKGIIAIGETEEYQLGTKSGLACVLAVIVSEKTMDEYLELINDPSMGDSRILLLAPLKKTKDPRAREAIEYLAYDPVFSKEIASWKKVV